MECKNCSSTLKENAKFCTICGMTIDNKQKNKTIEGAKKRLKWFYIILPVVISIFLLFLFLQFYLSADRQLVKMSEAFLANDEAAFANFFETANGEDLQEGFFYQAVEEYGWEILESELSAAMQHLEENNKQDSFIIHSYSGPLFNIEKTKKLGVFSDYRIQVLPQPVFIESSLSKVEVTIHNKTYDLVNADGQYLTDLLPGTYELTSMYESSFGSEEVEQTLAVGFFPDQNYVYINIEVMDVKLDGDISEAIVYIDGKTTGQSIDELQYIADIPIGLEVVAYAEYQSEDGNNYRSDEVMLSQEDIYFEFPEYEKYIDSKRDYKVELEEFFSMHRQAFLEAINYADFSIVADTFKKGTESFKEYEEFVNDHSKFDSYHYTFLENELKSFNRLAEDEFEFQTYETFEFTSEEDEVYLYERTKRYVVQLLNSESYIITEVENLSTNKKKL